MAVIGVYYTHLEDYIIQLYQYLSIEKPHQLRIGIIANRLGLSVYYGNATFRYYDSIILKRTNRRREWQSFGHEVGHYLRHHGNQLRLHPLFADLQEHQANHFAYHFCVPTFMLKEIKGVTANDIARLFNVEFDFALRRLEMYENKLIERAGVKNK